MKLRVSRATRMSKVPKVVFGCVLEYCEPQRIRRVTEHLRYNPAYPINYTWPEQVSYQNPIEAVKVRDTRYG